MDFAKKKIDELAEIADVDAIQKIKEIALNYPENIPYAFEAYGRIQSKSAILAIEGLAKYSQTEGLESSVQQSAHMLQALDTLSHIPGKQSVNAVRAIKRLSVDYPDFIKEGFDALLDVGSSEAYLAIQRVTVRRPEARPDALRLLKDIENSSAQKVYNTLLRHQMSEPNSQKAAPPTQKKSAARDNAGLMSPADVGRLNRMKRLAANTKNEQSVNQIRTMLLNTPRLISPGLSILSDMGTDKSIALIEEIADKFPIYKQECIDALIENPNDTACASVYDVLLYSPENARPLYDHGMVSYALEALMKNQSRNAAITSGEIVKMCPSHTDQFFDSCEDILNKEDINPSYYEALVRVIGDMVDENPKAFAPRGLSILSAQDNDGAQSVFDSSLAKINARSRRQSLERMGLSGCFDGTQPRDVPDPEDFKRFLTELLDDLELKNVDMPGEGFSELGQ